jgi:hypothetical protein
LIKEKFEVCALEKLGTTDQDIDQGVIRVAGSKLSKLGGRNALVKITVVQKGESPKQEQEPKLEPKSKSKPKPKPIIRIVRAATGEGGLSGQQIALQYDDRNMLGITSLREEYEIKIEPVSEWLGLPGFLLGHSSPLVRKEAVFGLALMFVGAVVGFIFGIIV